MTGPQPRINFRSWLNSTRTLAFLSTKWLAKGTRVQECQRFRVTKRYPQRGQVQSGCRAEGRALRSRVLGLAVMLIGYGSGQARSAGGETVASQQGVHRGEVELDSVAPRQTGKSDEVQAVMVCCERGQLLEEVFESARRYHF